MALLTQKDYIFQSERLGYRAWQEKDISKMAKINSDPEVMAFFPKIQDLEQTQYFIQRMQERFKDKGFCYFAVDRLDTSSFIGFIGVTEQTFKADFTPCIDIGWRLAQKEWGNGFATEGGKRCLEYAFKKLNSKKIVSMCSKTNIKSEKVMQKIGMEKVGEFKHPLLKENPELEDCVLYEIKNPK